VFCPQSISWTAWVPSHLLEDRDTVERRTFKWTPFQLDKLSKVKDILEDLKDYLPLTLRQVYYQLVSKGYIENSVSQYGMLSNLLKWARIYEVIPWNCIEDRVRTYHDLTGWEDSDSFIKQEIEQFLKDYRRDILQTQEKYIEVWIEKDALSSIFIKAAAPYTVPVVVCRGFSSVSFLNDYRERLLRRPEKIPVMLYFGDFDPSGVEMLRAMETTLTDELGTPGIHFKRIALTVEDIKTHELPHSPEALKKTDSRAKKHMEEYGELAVELDALRPDVLIDKIKEAIEAELDIDAFNSEIEKHNSELDKLNGLKMAVETFVTQREF